MIEETLAYLVAGFGLFFLALMILEESMKELVSGSVRNLIKKHTSTNLKAGLWGTLMGFVLEDPAVVGCIAGSLYTCKSMTLKRSVLMSLWSNIGSCLLLFVFFIDINLLILFIIGITATAYYYEVPFKLRHLMGALMAIALLLYSIQLMKSHTESLVEVSWIKDNIHYIQNSYFIPFIVAAILTVILQEDIVVLVLIVNLTLAGILSIDQAIILVFGMQLGLAIMNMLLCASIKGATKQILMIQVSVDMTIAIVFSILFIIELNTGVPLIKALAVHIASTVGNQLVVIICVANLSMTIIFSATIEYVMRLLQKISPLSDENDLFSPQFISTGTAQDPDSAIDLTNHELIFLFKRLPSFIEQELTEQENSAKGEGIVTNHTAFAAVVTEVKNFIDDISIQQLNQDTSERFLMLNSFLQMLITLEEGIFELTQLNTPLNAHENVKKLKIQLLESQHALLSIAIDVIDLHSMTDVEMLMAATEHTNVVIARIRDSYFSSNVTYSVKEKAFIFTATSLFDRNVWILHRFILQINNLPVDLAGTSSQLLEAHSA